MYAGKRSRFGLSSPAAEYGQLLVLKSHPERGLITSGLSSTECSPFHSVAGSLPSTGFVQSKRGSRRGTKLAWKYAMSPSASAKMVLFDELVCSSSERRNSARLRALVRVYDWVSAFTGSCISLTLIHFPSASRTMGP